MLKSEYKHLTDGFKPKATSQHENYVNNLLNKFFGDI